MNPASPGPTFKDGRTTMAASPMTEITERRKATRTVGWSVGLPPPPPTVKPAPVDQGASLEGMWSAEKKRRGWKHTLVHI
jgi:hypothetical protein